MHPKYGILLNLEFSGDRLVGQGASSGNVLAVHPMPEPRATKSDAETIRQFVIEWGGWMWAACLLAAVTSRTYGTVATELMLALTIACGVAWTVSPHYTITLRGIFSNDPLFFAAVMYLVSLAMLAWRVAPSIAGSERPTAFQFGLRALLGVMGMVAILTATGPLGYFAMCVIAVGALFFAAAVWICLCLSERCKPMHPADRPVTR